MEMEKQWCPTHEDIMGKGRCICNAPFTLYTFPRRDDAIHEKWVLSVNRFDTATKTKWIPDKYSRVCSAHFVDSQPTDENPIPTVDLGYKLNTSLKKPRNPPKDRSIFSPPARKNIQNLFSMPSTSASCNQNADFQILDSCTSANMDNKNCVSCEQCKEKDTTIKMLKRGLYILEQQLKKSERETKKPMQQTTH